MLRVAIVGRPNVGKSTLFNRFCGTRKAIVGDESGITRDRIQMSTEWRGRRLEFLDTGGMVPDTDEIIPSKVFGQVEQAIAESDLLLWVVDGRAGVTPLDRQLLPFLHKAGKPFWIAVNKLDVPELDAHVAPFYSLGGGEVFGVSAEHNRGVAAILDAIADLVQEEDAEPPGDEAESEIAVAVVGRPNVGKSSLVNRLLGMERTIVCETPGTTRDAVDTRLVREGKAYRMIDTAGIRRKGRTEARTERIGVIMARKHLSRADVALLLLDAEEGVTKLDAAIGGYASESGCSVLIVLNKWDKVAKDAYTLEHYTDSIRRRMKYLAFAPIITVSALTGQRVPKLFALIDRAWEERRLRVPSGVLNNIFALEAEKSWVTRNPAHRWDIGYITQSRGVPPTFVVFTSTSKPLHFSTERFIVNRLREKFGFFAVPIRLRQRLKKRRAGRAASKR
ncbi:MAG: ribosome biogenesis GTPase Der [Acidobacteria bacterium]|nr:ribosome biogenesis GTPase Der [Acidobacteriota bacterium]